MPKTNSVKKGVATGFLKDYQTLSIFFAGENDAANCLFRGGDGKTYSISLYNKTIGLGGVEGRTVILKVYSPQTRPKASVVKKIKR